MSRGELIALAVRQGCLRNATGVIRFCPAPTMNRRYQYVGPPEIADRVHGEGGIFFD
jgi:hypothetical protein